MFESGEAWYAVRVRPRNEKVISTALASKGLETFLPMYTARQRWADRWKVLELPLFSGYLFCRFDQNRRVPVLSTPGVLEVVGNRRVCLPVSEEEIALLQRVTAAGLKCEPLNHFTVGDRVRFVAGPLSGVEASVADLRKAPRLVVSVTLLQRSVLVNIESDWVESLEPRKLLALA
jgi:transcription antitermination factor NusG